MSRSPFYLRMLQKLKQQSGVGGCIKAQNREVYQRLQVKGGSVLERGSSVDHDLLSFLSGHIRKHSIYLFVDL